MAEGLLRRLGAVARDLNVGKGTIVDFLKDNGYADVNPNSKLDEKMYGILVGEFAADRKLKMEAETMGRQTISESMEKDRGIILEKQMTKASSAGKEIPKVDPEADVGVVARGASQGTRAAFSFQCAIDWHLAYAAWHLA